MTPKEFTALMEMFRRQYRGITKELEELILERINQGEDPQKAAKEVLTKNPVSTAIKEPTANLLLAAAINGTGKTRADFNKSMLKSMQDAVVNLPWSPDNMPLSSRLHKLDQVMRQTLDDEIQKAMKNGTQWVDLSRKIYDGYGYGKKINQADLPKYLKQLLSAGRKALGDDPKAIDDYRRLLRQVERRASRLKTPGLNAAYSELVKAAKEGKDKAIARAVQTAMEERSRYYAERIARTEIARAWADGFYAKTLDDEDVIAYKWKLSSNHPAYDICDFHTKANLYGLGAGVYPKNKMPRYPAHPHCRCRLVEVFDGELDGKTERDSVHDDGQKFLESLTPTEQRNLLGVDGRDRWRKGEPWEQHLTNWQAHENPRSRIKKMANSGENDIIKASQTITGHNTAPPRSSPNAVIDHIGKGESIKTRSIYNQEGYKIKDINTNNHGNAKNHPYGKNGEHAHDYQWENGILTNRTTRELTKKEREENKNIL